MKRMMMIVVLLAVAGAATKRSASRDSSIVSNASATNPISKPIHVEIGIRLTTGAAVESTM